MNTVFTSTGSLLAIIAFIIALGLYVQKFKAFKSLGPALTVIIFGIILSNLKIVPTMADVYGVIFQYAIPLSMTMMLLNVDLSKMLKLSKQPLLAMLFAVLSIGIVAFLTGLIFAPKLDEGWKMAGMFVGTYTGGSSNLTAIGTGLKASPETFAAANAADYVIGMPTLIFLFAAPAILKKSKKFKKFWPYSLNENELIGDDHEELMSDKKWSIKDISWLFAIGFIVTEVSTLLSKMAPDTMQSAVRILFITTIAIAIAQIKPIKQIKGSIDLGLFIALFFLAIIGFMVNLKDFFGSTMLIAVYLILVVILSLSLHLLLCRLFKIKYQYVVVSIVAAISDGATSALVAASAQWKSLVSIGVVLGALGNALGNYLGISVAYLLRSIIGG
ncbi:DUF819 domain-containing protein [Clostridiisalibacter paucivorans]|uniref:DUF819 family protein n=1 Tax=Clostridiisalibacter paucivorans TaxID=408753 RepID=UPI00047CEB3B|nr:DUF819 family protein [Clostridiisalibacter paucivorans]